MSAFTASNGLTVALDTGGDGVQMRIFGIDDYPDGTSLLMGYDYMGDSEIEALGEYFMAQRDEAMNRWRSKGLPDVVVYKLPQAGSVLVIDERDGGLEHYTRRGAENHAPTNILARSALEYFKAQKPDPLVLQLEQVGGGWVTIVQYTPGDDSQREEARKKYTSLRTLDLPARIVRMSELKS